MTAVARTSKRRNPPLPPPPSYQGPTRITWREACAIVGCSPYTLYLMAKEQRIPAVPRGSRWSFWREPLLLWREQQLAHGLEVAR